LVHKKSTDRTATEIQQAFQAPNPVPPAVADVAANPGNLMAQLQAHLINARNNSAQNNNNNDIEIDALHHH
jgi:hypothetical protein